MDQGVGSECINEGTGDGTQKMSKNQLKKLKRREKWLAVKQERRQQEKQKRKQRLAERREKGEDLGPTRKSLKTNTMKNSSCRIRVVLDLSLDEYMIDKDVTSLTCQLRHCYSANRRAPNPMQMYFCGSSGKTMKRLDEIGDYKGWDVHVDKRSYDEAFSKDSLVYLTSESPNILSALSEDKVYIIGGLVDHNQHKGLCHRLAEEKGIAHAQLPIAEYFEMTTRRVLAVNHVFSILLRFTEMHDWKKAFLSEMPQRKQASCREKDVIAGEEEKGDGLEEEDEVIKAGNEEEAGQEEDRKETRNESASQSAVPGSSAKSGATCQVTKATSLDCVSVKASHCTASGSDLIHQNDVLSDGQSQKVLQSESSARQGTVDVNNLAPDAPHNGGALHS